MKFFPLFFFALLLWASAHSVSTAWSGIDSATSEPEIPVARVQEIARVVDPDFRTFGQPIENREFWENFLTAEIRQELIQSAESLLDQPLPPTTDELFLDFSRTGNRTRWQRVAGQRRGRVDTLAIAECLENKGRFLPAFREVVEGLAEEPTWVYPAHDKNEQNFRGEAVTIDLGSSRVAWELATAVALLDGKLDPETRDLAIREIRRRVVDAFRLKLEKKAERDSWFDRTNNWNSVCLAGVLGAALAISEDPDERAFHIAAAEQLSENFLNGFTPDGYCSEGMSYWNYGFGHYLALAELVWQGTDGSVDLFNREGVRAPASYGWRARIAKGIYPTFSDCPLGAKPVDRYMWLVNRRFCFGWPEYSTLEPTMIGSNLTDLLWFSSPNSASETECGTTIASGWSPRTWFDNAGVLICRPTDESPTDSLSVAMKGGHNSEQHNHNDVGSYQVTFGGKTFLVDPGSEVYTKRTFSSRRYESDVLNSYGHPVPIVAGQLQKLGREAQGVVLQSDFTPERDTLSIDLTSAYGAPTLEKLVRTFIYDRTGDGTFTIRDTVRFKEPTEFGTAL
ncbi:MAG: heparinase II/III family protein, partial [Candidatus Omnitrophica bacterium]|nr:heparinase II/III family protein [Candidatus Omnitrophota bacterium]